MGSRHFTWKLWNFCIQIKGTQKQRWRGQCDLQRWGSKKSSGEYFPEQFCIPAPTFTETLRASATSSFLVVMWVLRLWSSHWLLMEQQTDDLGKQHENVLGWFRACMGEWVSRCFSGSLSSSLAFPPFLELVSLWEYRLGTHLPKNWLVPKRSSELIAYRDDVSFALGYINLDFSCFIL